MADSASQNSVYAMAPIAAGRARHSVRAIMANQWDFLEESLGVANAALVRNVNAVGRQRRARSDAPYQRLVGQAGCHEPV